MNFKVTKGKSLIQYNTKYRNVRYKLLKYTKKEVVDFDKFIDKELVKSKNYLLKGRKWVLIDDTYYEIPKPIRWVWFRNLSKGIQAATCVALAGVVAGSTVLTFHLIKISKMVDEEHWLNALNEITDITKNRNFTFTGEFDFVFTSNSSKTARIKETVFVVNNEEHVIKNIIKSGRTDTSDMCYKILDSNDFMVKEKYNGVWSEYRRDLKIYDKLPSFELQELSLFKIMYEDFKFNGDAYTYTQPATELDPAYIINVKFKHNRLVSVTTQQGETKNWRKFEFTNYAKTSLNI